MTCAPQWEIARPMDSAISKTSSVAGTTFDQKVHFTSNIITFFAVHFLGSIFTSDACSLLSRAEKSDKLQKKHSNYRVYTLAMYLSSMNCLIGTIVA